MTSAVDQLAADAQVASAAFHHAQQTGLPEAEVEELLMEAIVRYVTLGRALAAHAGLPNEHVFDAYRRAWQYMLAAELFGAS